MNFFLILVRIRKVRTGREDGLLRITSKGQITIPITIREKLGFMPYTEVEFEVEGETLRLKKIDSGHRRGKALIANMRGKAGNEYRRNYGFNSG